MRLSARALGLVALAAAVAAFAGCRSLDDRYPYHVVEVRPPADLVIAFPHGLEVVHLRYVSSATSTAEIGERARASIEERVAAGVDVRFEGSFPLSRDRRGQLQALVYADGDERPLNEDLLDAGLAWLDREPIGLFDGERAAEAIAALERARKARRGVHALLSPPEPAARTVGREVAERELGAASELVERHARARLPRDLDALLVDDAGMRAAQIATLGRPAPMPVGGFAPPGPHVYLAKALPGDDAMLRLLLVHELVHKLQYPHGLAPWTGEIGDALVRGTLAEGHAEWWTRAIARAAGLEATWTRMDFAAAHYAEGLVVWDQVYAALAAAGIAPALGRGAHPALDAVHARLLGPAMGAREAEVLLDPCGWLEANVCEWPCARPFRIEEARRELLPSGDTAIYWRLRASPRRAFFIHAQKIETEFEVLRDGRWQGGFVGNGSACPWRRVLGAGEVVEGVPLESLVSADELSGPPRRMRLAIEGFAASFAPDLPPLYYGRLTSPWVEIGARRLPD